MSARDMMRAQLETLMGPMSDVARSKYSDDNVCRNYLCGLCPNELFSNTKADLGACTKLHNVSLREQYDAANKESYLGYEDELMSTLSALVSDVDRKIAKAKDRLESENAGMDRETLDRLQEVQLLMVEIGIKLAHAEQLGNEGKVNESMSLMQEVEVLKSRRSELEAPFKALINPNTASQQKLRVCEICSAYLSIFDNDRRLADHFGGKMHIGYVKIRDRLTQLRENAKKRREERAVKDQERSKSRDQDGAKDRERDADKDKDRDRDRGRARSPDRRRKSRSPDRRRRSPDRHRRSRSPGRGRDRDRRRSRSRSPRRR